MNKILVVDDEPSVLQAFAELLGDVGHQVIAASSAEAAFDELQDPAIQLVILDVCLPGATGLDALRRIKAERPRLPVIVMTGQGTMGTAIEATKLGAFEYHLKPLEPAEMLQSVEKALEIARLIGGQVTIGTPPSGATADAIIGRSPAMQELYKAIGRVARTDATVLIRGDSGTGKELVARAIFQHSLRSAASLLVVNCAAIPETLLESELFGHEKGSFTGAVGRRIGKFEQAHGGTIFLDEIGDVPLGIQPKILRVLQEQAFERLGGNEVIRVDVRVLAATNRDLEQSIRERLFREDLYHRLNVVTLRVPPLRERRDDIPALADYFLTRFAQKLGVERPLLVDDAMQALREHPWPGNVRELEHLIHRLVIFARGIPLRAPDLQALLRAPGNGRVSGEEDGGLSDFIERHLTLYAEDGAYEALMSRVERLILAAALRRTKGNQTHAARLLGLPRPTLHAKMHKHNLHGEQDSA